MKKELLVLLAVAAPVLAIAALLTPSGVFTGAGLVDTDAYMRLVRVRLLVESGAWFDASIPRSNWPFGEVLHWTRPMDLVLLAGALPFWPFVGFDAALHASGLLAPPLLLLATFAAVAWAADPIAGAGSRGFVYLLLFAQLAVVTYAQPGRPDHHALILLLFAVTLGFAFRGLEDPRSGRWATGLGLSAAAGMWVSPEFLLPLALVLVGSMAAWIRRGAPLASFNSAWTGTFAATLAACLLVERGSALAAVEYDKISVVHLCVAAVAFAVWSTILRVRRIRDLPGARARALTAGVLGVLSLGLMAVVFPRFFGGPMVDVTDPVVLGWLARVRELQPILLPDDLQGLGRLLRYGGTGLVAIPYLVVSVRWDDERRDGRLLLLLGIAGVLALSLAQLRWITYVEIMSAIAVAELLGRQISAPRPETGVTLSGLLARASLSAALIAGPVLTGAVIGTTRVGDRASRTAGAAVPCDPDAVARFLSSDPRWRDVPRTLAANPDFGPALLYASPHRVLATPYHRNEAGIRAVYDLFASTDADGSPDLVRARDVDLVALCPDRDRGLFVETVEGRASLFGRLLAGETPAWLVEVDLPEEVGSARLFRVARP